MGISKKNIFTKYRNSIRVINIQSSEIYCGKINAYENIYSSFGVQIYTLKLLYFRNEVFRSVLILLIFCDTNHMRILKTLYAVLQQVCNENRLVYIYFL